MKKLFALLLAVLMTATLSVPALAATAIDGGGATSASDKDAGDYTVNVGGQYQENFKTVTDVISVDIAWDAMSFTYTANMFYNPGSHQNEVESGAWSTNKAGITVTNHSNVAIDATFDFAQAAALPSGTAITGTFYTKSGDTYTANTDKMLSLASGEDKTAGGETYTTPSDTLYFGIDSTSSALTETPASLGTVTVSIAKGAIVVTTPAALEATLEAIKTTGGTVKLGANITIPTNSAWYDLPVSYLELSNPESAPIVLDLGGNTVTGIILVYCSATSKIVIQNGTIACAGDDTFGEMGVVSVQRGVVELKNITVNATDMLALTIAGGDTAITDSEFNGGLTYNGEVYTVLLAEKLTLSGEVTVSDKMFVLDGKSLTFKAGCQYKINGATAATTVNEDTTYVGGSENLPDWIERLQIS